MLQLERDYDFLLSLDNTKTNRETNWETTDDASFLLSTLFKKYFQFCCRCFFKSLDSTEQKIISISQNFFYLKEGSNMTDTTAIFLHCFNLFARFFPGFLFSSILTMFLSTKFSFESRKSIYDVCADPMFRSWYSRSEVCPPTV